jgi:hypothetical protein
LCRRKEDPEGWVTDSGDAGVQHPAVPHFFHTWYGEFLTILVWSSALAYLRGWWSETRSGQRFDEWDARVSWRVEKWFASLFRRSRRTPRDSVK